MITLVYPYYENPTMLRKQLETWALYIDFVKIIVVDDGSQENPALNQMWFQHTNLQLYRVLPNIPWNQDGARNLAMKHATTEWAYMTDMDRLVPIDQMEAITEFAEKHSTPRHYYMFNQRAARDGVYLNATHPNSFLMRVEDFWSMGGYDEDFAGAYGSDGNFRRCAQADGLVERKVMSLYTIKYTGADIEDSRTREWGRKGSAFHVGLKPELLRKVHGPAYKAVNPIRFEWERIL